MSDLLSTELSIAELTESLSIREPSADLPSPEDPAWETVRTAPMTSPWVAELRSLAEDDCGRPIPELPETMYAEARATEDASGFEIPYGERRRMLARAALCGMLFPSEPVWPGRIGRCLRAILDEPSWAIPTHVHPENGIDPLHLDPEAAGTAFLVAQTSAATCDRLDPALVAAVRARLGEWVFDNYLARHGEFWWTRSAGHSNAVCHHGILGAALASDPDAGRVARMLATARDYLNVYVQGFGADGASLEGVQRWEQGLGCLVSLNDLIAARTIGQLSLFSPNPSLHSGARFGPRMVLAGGRLVNFGDASPEGTLDPALLFRLAEVFADDEIVWVAERCLAELAAKGIDFDSGEGTFRGWAALLLFASTSLASPGEAPPGPAVYHFEDASILVVRGRDAEGHLWEFAAKGGHNAEPNNHNDCGSYLLNVDGKGIVAEIGAPQLTHDYLHRKRYEYLAARTLGHSLPLVNGFEQPSGPQAVAKVLLFEAAGGVYEWSLDLASCYPPDCGCADLIRTFRVAPSSGLLEVRETFELSFGRDFETAIITYLPVIQTRQATLIDAGDCRFAVELIKGGKVNRIERQEFVDFRGQQCSVNRIVLTLESPAMQGSVGYRFRRKP